MTEKEIREKLRRICAYCGSETSCERHEQIAREFEDALTAAHRQGREEGLGKMRVALDRLEEQAERGGFTQSWRDALMTASDELNSLLSQPDGSGGEKETV